jgi:ABC-2 type transport system permease protein
MLLPMGIYFSLIVWVSAQQAMMGGPAPESTPINWLFVFLMIFLSPALTMRLLSDEARMGTLELLLTAPIRDAELVIGKWLGAFLCILTFIAISWVFPIFIYWIVKPTIDQGPLVSAYLVLTFAFGALIAIGMIPSALFSNSTAALFLGVGFSLMLFLFDTFSGILVSSTAAGGTSWLSSGISYISFASHFRDTALYGKLDVRDLVYYASWIVFGLFVTIRIVESKRWR